MWKARIQVIFSTTQNFTVPFSKPVTQHITFASHKLSKLQGDAKINTLKSYIPTDAIGSVTTSIHFSWLWSTGFQTKQLLKYLMTSKYRVKVSHEKSKTVLKELFLLHVCTSDLSTGKQIRHLQLNEYRILVLLKDKQKWRRGRLLLSNTMLFDKQFPGQHRVLLWQFTVLADMQARGVTCKHFSKQQVARKGRQLQNNLSSCWQFSLLTDHCKHHYSTKYPQNCSIKLWG